MESFRVFVQWERGSPHQCTGSVLAPDKEMALLFAKRTVDRRRDPVSIWVSPEDAFLETDPDDTTLEQTTDREYRNVEWYAQNYIDPEDQSPTKDE